ncbi:threonine ammonia-lyase [Sphingomicrobium flavum]|uniref:threonine ammonia-lyase n=1 Tax=Sphingomicrobium flavum TaxID=1229164 RepID=UPI0021AD5780|nr:threonine/serine dehydratase [Sphingomicrobium flavum]
MLTIEDVITAARRIKGAVRRTPLSWTQIHGKNVGIKWENQQKGGAFKLRGASNRLLALSPEEREKGVVAFSSGNHARGVAIAARRLGMHSAIVMPADAPKAKIDGTRSEGAEIILYDRMSESREEIAARMAEERGATLVPSFDDPYIVAGQGTSGLEILEQCVETGMGVPSQILVCCGGGGLSGGIALACPDSRIICIEPIGWDDMAKSLTAGSPQSIGPNPPPTMCDAIQTFKPAEITVSTLLSAGAGAAQVSEEEVKQAIRYAWAEHQQIVEPGGAVALAAALSGAVELNDGDVLLVSGGNVDPALHAEIVA